ncbi:MAG: hypothetical protein ACPG5P_05750, partial [Saprospiraceae bacterium]
KDLPKDNAAISPVIALVYRNLGDTYINLKKYNDAESAYGSGLEYTNANIPISLKRKSTLELRLSELYKKTKNKTLENEYANKAVQTYRKYEEELEKKKRM